jgi:hypothetical protein
MGVVVGVGCWSGSLTSIGTVDLLVAEFIRNNRGLPDPCLSFEGCLLAQLARQEILGQAPRDFSQLRIVAFAVGHGETVADAMEFIYQKNPARCCSKILQSDLSHIEEVGRDRRGPWTSDEVFELTPRTGTLRFLRQFYARRLEKRRPFGD